MTEPPRKDTGLVQSSTPGRRGNDVSLWGGTPNPFGQCPRFGGCPDVGVIADSVQDRLRENPPGDKPGLGNPESIDKAEGEALDLLTRSFKNQNLKSADMNDLMDKIGRKGEKITDGGLKNQTQAKANQMIDEFGQTSQQLKTGSTNAFELKQQFDAYTQTGRLIENLDRLGVQGRDLSFSRLNTYAAAFAQDRLQVGLQYRDALVTQLRTRPPGSNFERDKEDLRKLTETLGQAYPDRRTEFTTYQDQVLRSLSAPAAAPVLGR